MSNSIRDNTRDILRTLLMEQGNMTFDQAVEKASEIADDLGLDSKKSDKIGPARDVIIQVNGGIAEVVYQPDNVRVVILDFDNDAVADQILVKIS